MRLYLSRQYGVGAVPKQYHAIPPIIRVAYDSTDDIILLAGVYSILECSRMFSNVLECSRMISNDLE
jgi:hypothetical protein